MNQSDAERIAGLFGSLGILRADSMADADIFVCIMCSVRQMAVDRIFGLAKKINEFKKANPNFKSILTGCVVESDKLRFIKIFDHILDIKKLDGWPNQIGIIPCESPALTRDEPRFSALIQISEGCDNYCSYCVVPYTRGSLISRPAKGILNEVRRAIKNGAKEIWLLGQNVNNYRSGKVNFAKLLRMVNDISGGFWIRFTSPHPKDFTDETVEAMAKCEKVTPYLNLPIQSGDDAILRVMKRPYTVAQYKSLVKKLRSAFKKCRRGLEAQLAISTDVIVGFPGETKKQFQNTAKTFTTVKYDMAYIAQYSPRNGTAATKLCDNVPPMEKKHREEIINNIVKKTALAHNKKYLGKTVSVLIDSAKGRYMLGKARSYKTVKFPNNGHAKPGDIVKVRVTKVMDFALIGTISNE
jgi:tRNA-2-methylthio-N6-dimethylallyladenosine synthase